MNLQNSVSKSTPALNQPLDSAKVDSLLSHSDEELSRKYKLEWEDEGHNSLLLECPDSFARLLRWSLINLGLLGVLERLETEVNRNAGKTQAIRITIRGQNDRIELEASPLKPYCVLSITRKHWTDTDFAAIEDLQIWFQRVLKLARISPIEAE